MADGAGGDLDPLRLALARGARRWPAVRLSIEALQAHVTRAQVQPVALEERAEEIYLAASAALGDPAAVAELDRSFLVPASAAVTRVDASEHFIDEVRQELRVSLFTGEKPRLNAYAGLGGLLDWLRVAAVRTALNLKRSGWRMLPAEELTLQRLMPQHEPDLAALRHQYLPRLQQAMAESLAGLSTSERNVLRLHFIDGLSLDTLATMYGVHRATIARRLAVIRRAVLDEARLHLGGEQPWTSQTVRSLYRWLARDLHLSAGRLLQDAPGDPEAVPGDGGRHGGSGPRQ